MEFTLSTAVTAVFAVMAGLAANNLILKKEKGRKMHPRPYFVIFLISR